MLTAIWHNDGAGWHLMAPSGFPDEAALHTLIEEAPQMLPLAGTPTLAVVGREVSISSGYADLIVVEPSGRLVIIEVKLARNAEARRAIIAQVLTYAADLHGMDVSTLEGDVLGSHLRRRGYDSLAGAMAASDQTGSFDASIFSNGLAESLSQGRFRLVLVLDSTPQELVRLVGYFASITDKLLVDLIAVSAYTVNGSRILVPQRVDPERQVSEGTTADRVSKPTGRLVGGAGDFLATIEAAPEHQRPDLHRLHDWAVSLEREGLVKLFTYHGKEQWTLLPRLQPENVGLVTIWNSNGAYLQLWRSVFERRAPRSLLVIEELIAPAKVGQGSYVSTMDDRMLEALKDAYREAAEG